MLYCRTLDEEHRPMNRAFLFSLLLIVIVAVGFGCVNRPKTKSSDTPNREIILEEARIQGLIMDQKEVEHMKDPSVLSSDEKQKFVPDVSVYLTMDFAGWKAAALADVTVDGQRFGLAHATFEKGTFTLVAIMGGLPPAPEGFFYEGWLIKRGDRFRVLSTGRAEISENKFVNVYRSAEDLSSFDFYSLTLEPENGNPGADGDHLLEGMIR